MKSSYGPEPIPLPLALTIPAVMVCSNPNGLPTATTQLPTFRSSELPRLRGCKSEEASILIRARSVLGSRPTILPSYSLPFASFTLIWSAFSTTWLLVRMYPSRFITNPDPTPRCSKPLGGFSSEKGPKKSPKGFFSPNGIPEKWRNPKSMFFIFFTTWIFTTPRRTFSASSLKFDGTIGISKFVTTVEFGVVECLTAVDTPYPNPTNAPTIKRAIMIFLKCFLFSMVLPPFLVLGLVQPIFYIQF